MVTDFNGIQWYKVWTVADGILECEFVDVAHDVCDACTFWVSEAIVYTNTMASSIWVPLRVI